MLFSNEVVVREISRHFEPVWLSVRPVPIVTVDFGEGNVVRRTLQGNIASFVCNCDGVVIDVLPGLYEPTSYAAELGQARDFHKWWRNFGPSTQSEILPAYHRGTVAINGKKASGLPELDDKKVSRRIRRDSAKSSDEGAVKDMIKGPSQRFTDSGRPIFQSDKERAEYLWQQLVDDSAFNQQIRREQIHAFLNAASPQTPNEMLKWLYREVLHADLDDPYLGLRNTLFSIYPYGEENRLLLPNESDSNP